MKKDLYIAILMFIGIGFGFYHTGEHTVLDTKEVTHIRVQSGDTLWSIAGRNVSSQIDIREYIYAIQTINKLDNGTVLSPGTTIKLPTQKTVNSTKELNYLAKK